MSSSECTSNAVNAPLGQAFRTNSGAAAGPEPLPRSAPQEAHHPVRLEVDASIADVAPATQEDCMAKKRKRKYSRGSGQEVEREMHRYKRGKAKSGRGGWQGEEPQAGHCDRSVQSTKERKEGSEEEVAAGSCR
jgi:hypothetical protein